jgi:hypothetical protein
MLERADWIIACEMWTGPVTLASISPPQVDVETPCAKPYMQLHIGSTYYREHNSMSTMDKLCILRASEGGRLKLCPAVMNRINGSFFATTEKHGDAR